MPHHIVPHREALGSVRRQQGKHGKNPYLVSVGRSGRGRVSSLGLASLKNFSRLWRVQVVMSCLVLGYRVLRAHRSWPRV